MTAIAQITPKPTKAAIIQAALRLAEEQHNATCAEAEKAYKKHRQALEKQLLQLLKKGPEKFSMDADNYNIRIDCTLNEVPPDILSLHEKMREARQAKRADFPKKEAEARIRQQLTGESDMETQIQALLSNPKAKQALATLLPQSRNPLALT
jgi:hypothetical protein